MLLGGLAFGLNADFGNDMLAHPLIVFFALVAAGLLVLRRIAPSGPGNSSRAHSDCGVAIGVAAYSPVTG